MFLLNQLLKLRLKAQVKLCQHNIIYMPDQILDCIDCKNEFEHTERDQEFYAERKFTPPKRCRNCRMKKKARMGDNRSRPRDRKSTRLNSSHSQISYAVFCLK